MRRLSWVGPACCHTVLSSAPGGPARAADDWFAIAGAGKPWWSQAKSEAIAIAGRIYQEAYTRNWVSYDAAATGVPAMRGGEWGGRA